MLIALARATILINYNDVLLWNTCCWFRFPVKTQNRSLTKAVLDNRLWSILKACNLGDATRTIKTSTLYYFIPVQFNNFQVCFVSERQWPQTSKRMQIHTGPMKLIVDQLLITSADCSCEKLFQIMKWHISQLCYSFIFSFLYMKVHVYPINVSLEIFDILSCRINTTINNIRLWTRAVHSCVNLK